MSSTWQDLQREQDVLTASGSFAVPLLQRWVREVAPRLQVVR